MNTRDDNAWERFRLQTQVGERSEEGHRFGGASPYSVDDTEKSPSDSPSEAPSKTPLLQRGPLSRLSPSKGEFTLIVIAIVGLVAGIALSVWSAGLTKTSVFALVALIPLTLVTFVLLHADRLAPLRLRYLVYSFLWGAGIATSVAAAINSGLFSDLISYLGQVEMAETRLAVIVAPVSEELMKGVGVVLVLLLARRHLVSKRNGVVVGGLVGAGFAFTENIIYFVQAHAEGSAVLGVTIFARGVLSPFIHPMATSFTGLGVAAALLAGKGVWGWTWRVTSGFLVAVVLHAMWNGFATLGSLWLLFYVLVELPLLVVWLVWLLRGSQKRMQTIGEGLRPYVATGWITGEEATMASNPIARRHALKWSKQVGRPARKAVKKHLRASGRIGLSQLNMERLGADAKTQEIAFGWLKETGEAKDVYLAAGEQHAIAAAAKESASQRDANARWIQTRRREPSE